MKETWGQLLDSTPPLSCQLHNAKSLSEQIMVHLILNILYSYILLFEDGFKLVHAVPQA